uniref:NADH-ubiquinone oxidoreductase chain 3 n=2 Tax=Polygyridae TaxID=56129 RepID=A0A1J0MRN9_9EUPU|nr:NADH dehydrogenase subunit 3 [Polygyra cereolus]YP_009328193.1 NADH dehydrogenase subunit 3 [Praticolella mexicana]APD28034.1 NADH dehydrogenase subunit 3 [Praticolella mexicana]APD28047.1 NADH dehydrogenase subunit 3 [Polygyra cereolus]
MLLIFLLLISLSLLLLILYYTLSYSTMTLSNQLSPFECGFQPFSTMRRPFSLRYFILVVLFLIFDIETIILLPWALNSFQTSILGTYPLFFCFLSLLFVGLLYEWTNGLLDWMNL